MLNSREKQRYNRQLILDGFGEDGQQKLKQATVLIVGLGGLGSPVAMYLAAAGVGKLILADDDIIDLSNLQRQILYFGQDVGKSKVDIARRELLALNKEVEIETIDERMDEDSLDYYAEEVDLVIDCTDNLATRSAINVACLARYKPFITGAALGWEGQYALFDYREQREICYNCMVPEESNDPIANCSTLGVLGPVLGVVGSAQALMAINLLIGLQPKANVLHRFDGKRATWLTADITHREDCICDNYR